MDYVILKQKENRKKRNDAYRKRLKEKTSSRTIIRSLIMEKQRKKEYYKQNRNIVRERMKKNHEKNQEVLSLRCKSYYQQNASKICQKRKEDYKSFQKDTIHKEKNKEKLSTESIQNKRKSITKNNTNTEATPNKRGKFSHDLSLSEDECENFEEEGCLPRELDEPDMEKLVQKIREKICFSTCIDGDMNRHRAHVCVI
jgi:hypothetical protein